MKNSMIDFLESLPVGGEEWQLAAALDSSRLPRHVAIIMDGNGRWAQRRLMPRAAGHRAGANAVRAVTETCARLGLEALTLYAFSVENWKRPRLEVETLWNLLRKYLREEFRTLMENNVRLNAVGRISELPDFARIPLDETAAATASNTGMVLNLAINYGGRAEIVDAVNALLREAARTGTDPVITEAAISRHLYTSGLPDPDLLIRTSGEMRVSNFLLWQIAYAELHVTDTLWPDFGRLHLLRALLDYQKRDRRYGGLSAPLPEVVEPRELAVPMR
jgi:undecaprenyl diphosphate synthase